MKMKTESLFDENGNTKYKVGLCPDIGDTNDILFGRKKQPKIKIPYVKCKPENIVNLIPVEEAKMWLNNYNIQINNLTVLMYLSLNHFYGYKSLYCKKCKKLIPLSLAKNFNSGYDTKKLFETLIDFEKKSKTEMDAHIKKVSNEYKNYPYDMFSLFKDFVNI
jgi:hypothetical protein